MSGHAISLASGIVPECGPVPTIEAAAAGGFDAVGLWVVPADWTTATTTATRRALAASGLPVLDVEVIWLKPGALDPDHLRLLDIGLELGAANALVVSSDADLDGTADKLAALCRHVAGSDLKVTLEFGLFTEIHTLARAQAVIERVAHPNAAILVDTLHLARSGGTAAELARAPRTLFHYAQLCDAPAIGPRADDPAGIIEEAVDGRLQTGEGDLPLGAVLDALPPGLPLSIELRSKALRETYPEPAARAKAVAEATRRFLAGRETAP